MYLLDTHTLLWYLRDSEDMSEAALHSVLNIRSVELERLKTLPDVHRDPFDRLLVAQALESGLAIVTRDRIIPQYPVQTVW